MATSTFACGFECGQIGSSGGVGQHWSAVGTPPTFSTTTVRSGSRSLRINFTNSNAMRAACVLGSVGSHVGRVYIRFATLPTVDARVLELVNQDAIYYKTSEGKLYLRRNSDGVEGASGVSVTTDVWYRIDWKRDTSGSTMDAQVDGVALGQLALTDTSNYAINLCAVSISGGSLYDVDCFYDDLIISQTLADYPLGAGYVNHFVPTADGTHSVAGANDFERGDTGTDILNATTDAYLLVDDVPLDDTTPDTNDSIALVAPPSANDYVEVVFGPAPGISTPTAGPRAVEVICGIHQAGTGTGNMALRMNDNGALDDVYSATGVAGTTTLTYKRKHYADPPSAASAWTVVSGNGNFNNVRLQFGSPAAVDANPDQYLDCAMIEAEFVEVVVIPRFPPTRNVNQATNRAATF